MLDVAVIGGGVIGCATAYTLSQYKLQVAVLEKENDIATGATRANSAIIHAGYDPEPDTLMAKLNVLGNAMTPQLCEDLQVPFQPVGSLVLAFTDEDMHHVQKLYDRGCANGVPGLEIWDAARVKAEEPHVTEQVKGALYAPSAGIIGPWEFALALGETAAVNGVKFHLNCGVTAIEDKGDHYHIVTENGEFDARYVVNAAGVNSANIHNMVAAPTFTVTPNRGDYFLMDKSESCMANRVLFQCPTALGKGVLVSPTVGGNLIVGPSAVASEDGQAVGTTADGLDIVRKAAAISVPGLNYRGNIRTFAGMRANTDRDDFIIEEAAPRFIDLAGIKSPGLSSAAAIGPYCLELLVKSGLKAEKDPTAVTKRNKVVFHKLSAEEKAEAVKNNPLYGRVICRCETITEGEIVDAIHSPIPPCSVDGVKRRCGAGMGRCQGGFCGPRVVEILSRELGISPMAITKDTAGSYILDTQTKKEGANQ